MTSLLLSVVIPTLDEAANLAALLRDVARLTVPHEVVVADGGSTDGTTCLAREMGATVVSSRRGRGCQLSAGAEAARAPLLCFLHADVRLPDATVDLISELALARPPCAFAFRLRIAAEDVRYRVIELGAWLRSRWLHLPYGDQGLVVRREDYERAGGFPPIPLMEDVVLVRALRKVTRLHLLPEQVRVSDRRWRRDGMVRRTLRNWSLLARFLAGAAPERLAARYDRPDREVRA